MRYVYFSSVVFWSNPPQNISPAKLSPETTAALVSPISSVGMAMPTALNKPGVNQHDVSQLQNAQVLSSCFLKRQPNRN